MVMTETEDYVKPRFSRATGSRSFTPGPWRVEACGSGIVPLMAILRSRAAAGSAEQFRLLYSNREPAGISYRDELRGLSTLDSPASVACAYTRAVPPGWNQLPGRIDAALIAGASSPANLVPTCYVCGPTSFVENAASLLTACGHSPKRIRTGRFGPAGERK